MTFSMFCVGVVIIVVILCISLFVGILMTYCTDDEPYSVSWFINGICFGICLTILLYQNGIL